MLPHREPSVERRKADEPDGEEIAGVERVVQETGKVEEEEVVGEVLCFVDDEDGITPCSSTSCRSVRLRSRQRASRRCAG